MQEFTNLVESHGQNHWLIHRITINQSNFSGLPPDRLNYIIHKWLEYQCCKGIEHVQIGVPVEVCKPTCVSDKDRGITHLRFAYVFPRDIHQGFRNIESVYSCERITCQCQQSTAFTATSVESFIRVRYG